MRGWLVVWGNGPKRCSVFGFTTEVRTRVLVLLFMDPG